MSEHQLDRIRVVKVDTEGYEFPVLRGFGETLRSHPAPPYLIVEIAPSAGGPSVLLPFTKAFVPEVDIAGGRIVIERLAPQPSPLVGEGGERTKSASRVRGRNLDKPLTRSEPSARTTLSRKGRG